MKRADIGIIGLGVMGKSLARNFASNGFSVVVYNIPLPGEEQVVTEFINSYGSETLAAANNLHDLVSQLKKPCTIVLMIKSGEPVDQVLGQLKNQLKKDDIIIDGGNSFFKDSIRRYLSLQKEGIEFVSMGVSGGEEGALKGPSLMPSGSDAAKINLLPILKKISAKADGKDCVSWIGNDGAGHFIKMVHNAIEYADMQVIAECYAIAKTHLLLDNQGIAEMFKDWNSAESASYLLEISTEILHYKEGTGFLLDNILDVAESKGTGLWALQEALQLGVPVPCLHAAINERSISGLKALRNSLNNQESQKIEAAKFSEEVLKSAMLFARLVALAEGFHLISIASKHYRWNMDLVELAQTWRGGCIIRSNLLPYIIEAYTKTGKITHLFESEIFRNLLQTHFNATAQLMAGTAQSNVSTPAINAALNYFKSLHTHYLPMNLIQAQRDYFGAHTYKRLDSGEQSFHTQWKK